MRIKASGEFVSNARCSLSNRLSDVPKGSWNSLRKSDNLKKRYKSCMYILLMLCASSVGSSLNVNDRAIVISAITMSLLKCFEPIKALTLITATTNDEMMLAVRATVGAVIALQENHRKIGYYPELVGRQ